MEKTLTIVIPTYNMEKYLDKCLTSLIVSDELMSQLEVLVVNDGSKDRSSDIAHCYESRYPQTFRVIDKENGNYGSCVNRGLKEAKGKYIKILDADDFFITSSLENLLAFLKNQSPDIVLTEMSYVYNDRTVSEPLYTSIAPYHVINLVGRDAPILPKLMMHYVCYRVELLREIHYRQTEGISYTDQEWIFYPFFYVRSLCYLPINLYQYNVGREGQTMNPQTMLKNISHNKMIVTRAFLFFQQYGQNTLPSVNAIEIKRQIKYQFTYLYNMYLKQQGSEYDQASLIEIDKLLKQNPSLYREIGNNPYHRYFPIPYIKFWRLMGKRLNFDLFLSLYHKLK